LISVFGFKLKKNW